MAETAGPIAMMAVLRRTSNIAAALAEAIHEYLTAATLRRFYTSAAEGSLAQLYAAGEAEARGCILTLLHTKLEPVYDED